VGYRVRGAPDALVFQTFSDLEGYLWSFPRLNHASVGIGGRLGTLPPRKLWQRLNGFLNDVCPRADKASPEQSRREERWAALLPLARDPTLWDTPCAGPGWALLGDAAGHVHPITGEGLLYALWSADLLAEAFGRGAPQAYDSLWREAYGRCLIAASTILSSMGSGYGAYELVFQLTMTMALQSTAKAR
jgi:flavin-dependent dehydrogenase